MNNEEIRKEENDHDGMCMQLIKSGIDGNVIQGILGLSLCGENYNDIQKILITYSKNENENIRGIAILGFGHIARRFGKINKPIVLPIINEALKDKSSFIRRQSDAALDGIMFFVK